MERFHSNVNSRVLLPKADSFEGARTQRALNLRQGRTLSRDNLRSAASSAYVPVESMQAQSQSTEAKPVVHTMQYAMQETPAELLKTNTPLFCVRIVLAALIIALASILMVSGNILLFAIGLLLQGAMYVHLVELQHSVLHLHAFSNARVNRFVGVLLGLPMLISFSDFQYRHLRHHKHLGTPLNSETFSYHTTSLGGWGFLRGMLDYSRWQTIAKRIFKAYTNQQISDGMNPLMESRIRQEYRVFGFLLSCAILTSLITGSFWPIALWLMPLVTAEPVHFLLELPEHLGMKAHSNPNVFENTRIWGGSWFARWYSHNTNYHLMHHFNQLVPMHNLPKLEAHLSNQIPAASRSKSYPDFFLQVIRGEIRAEDGD